MTSPAPRMSAYPSEGGGGANLADILERVLDKGIVIAGDIRINLLDIELLTIKLRLIVTSVERAKEMGIDWWESDPELSSGARDRELAAENAELKRRLAALETPGRAALPQEEHDEEHEDGQREERRTQPRGRKPPRARKEPQEGDEA
ncbi:gas vesicle protein [Streptomyces sp. NPDC001941]|uniref:gas vesicle protein n=1 Tax=Streptomyces sp. NPDC001941 TaxID=3154659 RepID=UPI00331C2B8A